MVQLLQYPFFVEEEAPALDIQMPRVFKRPPASAFRRGRALLKQLLARLDQARQAGDTPEFGRAYSELAAEYLPAIEWARSCWEYLLTTEGCRFLARPPHEKEYFRGDYKVMTEREFESMAYRSFKECVAGWLEMEERPRFERHVRSTYWKTVLENYQALENPPDTNQRKLTGWSYLRCVPYEFLNAHHHRRVYDTVAQLPAELRQMVELYYLSFYREEAVLERTQTSRGTFLQRREEALRLIASSDYLSSILLQQIERY